MDLSIVSFIHNSPKYDVSRWICQTCNHLGMKGEKRDPSWEILKYLWNSYYLCKHFHTKKGLYVSITLNVTRSSQLYCVFTNDKLLQVISRKRKQMRNIETWDTLLTSCKVMSFPPVILYTTPVADWMEDPIKGARVACSAASSARFLLEETPTPSIAVPEFFITAFTSAKSTFTSPGIYRSKYKIVIYSTCFQLLLHWLFSVKTPFTRIVYSNGKVRLAFMAFKSLRQQTRNGWSKYLSGKSAEKKKEVILETLTVIISDIPWTPWRKTSSAKRKASCSGVCSSAISNRRSLGITIRVSTFFWSLSIASWP